MKRYRFTPGRKRALAKARLAAARSRSHRAMGLSAGKGYRGRVGTPRTRNIRSSKRGLVARRVAVGTAVAGTAAVGAYQINYHSKYVTGYHRTSFDAADAIVANKEFKTDIGKGLKTDLEGEGLISFDKHRSQWLPSTSNPLNPLFAFHASTRNRFVGARNRNFGPATVKVKYIPKRAVVSHRRQIARAVYSNPASKVGPGNGPDQRITRALRKMQMNAATIDTWFGVKPEDLKGVRVSKVHRPLGALTGASPRLGGAARRRMQQKRADFATYNPWAQYMVHNWKEPIRMRRTRGR